MAAGDKAHGGDAAPVRDADAGVEALVDEAGAGSPPPLRIVGLTNSLRATSYNRMTLAAIGRLMSPAMHLQPHDIDGIPFYDADDDPGQLSSRVVQALEQALLQADGLAVALPEYNHSIPARLKNALDVLSRVTTQPLEGMPVMIVSASTGRLGGARAQYELRRVLDAVGAVPLVKPEVFIGHAADKFDAAGDCTDAPTRQVLQEQIRAFESWIMAVSGRRRPSSGSG